MARKVRGFERILDAPSLFAVAYGEIASSLYIALGIVAAQALGLTPLVLLLTGALFLTVSLSYAEGTAALPETGGAATFVRRAFNDLAGFVTGWALFLDFLIVMALSALFMPHYLGAAVSAPSLRDAPWDVLIGCLVIAAIAAARLTRRTRLYTGALAVAILDLAVQGLLVLLGVSFLLSPETLREGFGLASGQEWGDLAFALPLAMLAYTGLETAANLAEEAREPGRTLPRSLFSAIGLVVLVTVLIAAVGLSAYPAAGGSTSLGDEWLEAPLVGIAAAFEGELPGLLVDVLRIAIGVSGALVLLGAATTSVSGITRLTYSLAEHGSLPREFARFERRALVSSQAILIAAGLGIGTIVLNELAAGGDPEFLASVYSFGVLLAFTAAQLAVIWLRVREPALTRPFRARPEVTILGHRLPLAAVIGAPATFAIWILALATHPGARYVGPLWLLAGLAVFVVVRRTARRGLLDHVTPFEELPPATEFQRILVPMKLGDIGEEMVATAIAIAKEKGSEVLAFTVVRVPRRFPLEGELPP
ncbi:MAG: APC family permease, partial [Actinobacteria bacterium]|nr:APC family permease [Actinomycetota bacterium]